MFHLYTDLVKYPQCVGWWMCNGSNVTLIDGHVRITLHSPGGCVLLSASIHWDGVRFYADAVCHAMDKGGDNCMLPYCFSYTIEVLNTGHD